MKNHQGVVAFLSQITYHDITGLLPAIFESGEDPLILMLDGVSDVRNFGAIARSAECAGVHAIVIPASGSAAINSDAMKTSAGALHRIPVCRHKDLRFIVKFLRESGLTVFAATEKALKYILRNRYEGAGRDHHGLGRKGCFIPVAEKCRLPGIHPHEREYLFA